jgi:hypothetical protein
LGPGELNVGARALVLPFPQATSAYDADAVGAAMNRRRRSAGSIAASLSPFNFFVNVNRFTLDAAEVHVEDLGALAEPADHVGRSLITLDGRRRPSDL